MPDLVEIGQSEHGLRRQLKIKRELPSVLDLLIVCLEAGVGLTEAFRIVARETARYSGVIGSELTTSAAEMEAGVSLEDSLRALGKRTGVADVKSLAALVVQSVKTGHAARPGAARRRRTAGLAPSHAG